MLESSDDFVLSIITQDITLVSWFLTSCLFCLFPRMLHTKTLGRPPSLAHMDKVNSNSLDSCITIHDLPPKVPPYSKLQDLAGSHTAGRLTPSPAPILHIDSPSSYTSDSLSLSGSPLLYPKLMHRSMESLPLTMSVPCSSRFLTAERHDKQERTTGTWGAGSRTSLNLTDRQVSEERRCDSVISCFIVLFICGKITNKHFGPNARRHLYSYPKFPHVFVWSVWLPRTLHVRFNKRFYLQKSV